jgi:hypothetical protein
MIEKEIASGIKANPTTAPAKISALGLPSHCRFSPLRLDFKNFVGKGLALFVIIMLLKNY